MKTISIPAAAALILLSVSSCDSPQVVSDPAPATTTTTVTQETVTPDPYFNPGVTQTTKTTKTTTVRP